jgi:hypothetical protein
VILQLERTAVDPLVSAWARAETFPSHVPWPSRCIHIPLPCALCLERSLLAVDIAERTGSRIEPSSEEDLVARRFVEGSLGQRRAVREGAKGEGNEGDA